MQNFWWLPGTLVGVLGIAAIIGGLLTGGPDAIGGIVFGGMALVATVVIVRRRVPQQ